jgi:hypothetical protein
MNDIAISISLVATAAGFFAFGRLVERRSVQRWRIRWIELEYDLAHFMGRKPRNITDLYPKG